MLSRWEQRADDDGPGRQVSLGGEPVEGGEELAPREVSGGAEEHEGARLGVRGGVGLHVRGIFHPKGGGLHDVSLQGALPVGGAGEMGFFGEGVRRAHLSRSGPTLGPVAGERARRAGRVFTEAGVLQAAV